MKCDFGRLFSDFHLRIREFSDDFQVKFLTRRVIISMSCTIISSVAGRQIKYKEY